MKDIVFTLELYDDSANSRANEYLQKGWQLLHVGSKLINTDDGAYHDTVYVVGANQKQYKEYESELSEDSNLESVIKNLENETY